MSKFQPVKFVEQGNSVAVLVNMAGKGKVRAGVKRVPAACVRGVPAAAACYPGRWLKCVRVKH